MVAEMPFVLEGATKLFADGRGRKDEPSAKEEEVFEQDHRCAAVPAG